MKYLVFIIIFSFFGCTQTGKLPYVASGTIERIENFPSQHIPPRNVDIWLPSDYDPGERYAVLYMHDGQMLFDAAITWNKQEWGVDETMSRLMNEGKIRKTIVAGVWNDPESRHSDYFPQKPFESLPASYRDSLISQVQRSPGQELFSTDVRSDAYLAFLVEELKPYIDSTFATKADPANTFVAGASMGGLISMYAICEYPDVFGGAACLSTHWPGIFTDKNNPIPEAFMAYMEEHLPDPATHKLYFDYGTETLDAMYEPYQVMADSVLYRKGFREDNWKTVKFPGDDHSEKSWQKRLDISLTFLLRE